MSLYSEHTGKLTKVCPLNKHISGLKRDNDLTFSLTSNGGAASSTNLSNVKKNPYTNKSKLPSSIEGIINGN